LARDLKAASESSRRIFCFIEPTTRWQRIICSSMGNLAAIMKNRTTAELEEEVMSGWPELKIIAQENDQGKELSSQLIQHSKLQTKLMAGLCWVGNESFEHKHNFCVLLSLCNFKGGVFFPSFTIPVFPFLVLDVSKISATCNEPLNDFKLPIRCPPQRSASPVILQCDINTSPSAALEKQTHSRPDNQMKGEFLHLCSSR